MTSLSTPLFRLVDSLIPDSEKNGGEEKLRNARIVYSALILIMLNVAAFGILGLIQRDKVLPWIVLGTGFLSAFTPLLHRRLGSIRIAAAWISALCTMLLIATGLLSGGMQSSSMVWFGALAVFNLVTLGTSAALLWTCGMAAGSMGLWWLTVTGYPLPDFENPETKAISWALSFSAAIVLIILMLKGFFDAHRQAILNMARQARVLGDQAAELLRSKAVTDTALRSRSDFIATVSHEIRTPMNGILGVAELMRDTPLSSLQLKYLDALTTSAEGLLSIVGDILDFSKIESGKFRIDRERFSLPALCKNSVSVFAGITESKGLRLSWGLDGDLPEAVLGDPVRIRQILINLIGNGVKFTDKGGVRLEVRRVQDRSGWFEFAITDDGIGMDAAVLASLFQPYTQGDSSSSRKYGGSGLGLAICDRLVDMMGGTIAVESKPGGGSTFRVRLPLQEAPATPRESGPLENEAPAPAISLEPAPPRSFLSKRVLLAEDNPVNRMVAINVLAKSGATVEVAMDGKEAVSLWKAGNYDIIFMDCQMPIMDGYDATRTIRALERETGAGRSTPIIALTAHAMAEDRERCRAAGMDEYLTKPVKAATLMTAMNQWIPGAKP